MTPARCVGLLGTLALHAAVLALLLHATARAPRPPPKPVPVSIGDRPGTLRGEEYGTGLSCGGYHFNGIGLQFGAGTGRILTVGPGTPAERAGLLAGDFMLDTEQLSPDRFPPGHRIVLRILRAGLEIGVPVVVGRICNEE